jgi:DNA-binding transcriptional MerR regulator
MSKTATERFLSINEASKVCGLSASILRIWELRYSWPNPVRHDNGYRAYPPQMVDDLKRIAERHRAGVPVRDLIQDGRPVLPEIKVRRPLRRLSLDYTRSLGGPHQDGMAQQLRKELVLVLETRRLGQVHELLQQATWRLRRDDEIHCCLLPIVAGLAELKWQKRPMPGDTRSLEIAVITRCRQLRRQIGVVAGEPLAIVTHTPADQLLAGIAVLLLALRGINTVILDAPPTDGDWLLAGNTRGPDNDEPRFLGRLAALPEKHAWDLRQLIDAARLPWQPVAA